ncbi:hypothetical protein BASA83_006256 [Batrachochytrium salamandrivorans]|nr:hypothetical protein BASA83_006256 [Batrachochytrium salamandrivorans]
MCPFGGTARGPPRTGHLFELGSHLGPWTISGLGVCPPYSQPLPMPSSSFLVRGIDERIRDLPMQAEMKAHSHRAVPNVSSPICNEFNPPKIQIIRSGFGQNHHLVSRPARELPQMGGGRKYWVQTLFWRPHINESLPHDVNIPIGRTVVHLPPPAVHLLPRPVPSSLTPEILAPTVVDPIQTLSVAVSHTPDRSPAKISGILKRKRAEHEMMSAARPSKIRRIQRYRIWDAPRKKRIAEKQQRRFTRSESWPRSAVLAESGWWRPATPSGFSHEEALKAYTRGNQIRPDLLLTPRGKPSVGRLISFWDAPMVAMGISPPPEVYGEVFSYVATTPCQAQNEQCQDMDVSPPKLETGWESPIAQSSDLPRQSVSVEKIDCLWADPEEELGDLSSLPDDELYHLLGDHEEEELEHLWGVSSGSVDDSVKITPKIATISADNFFRIRTPESPKVETMDMDMSGFLGKENMTPSPTLKSSVSKGCVANAICSAFSLALPHLLQFPFLILSLLPRPFSYTRGLATTRTSHGANGFRKKRIGRL